MPLRFNPITSQLDLVGATSTGVTGPSSSTDKAITRWNGTSGNVVQDSLAIIQDSGSIEAQAFISKRHIINTVTVNSGESWIAPSIELELTGSIEVEPDGEIIVV